MRTFTKLVISGVFFLMLLSNINAQEMWGMTEKGGDDDVGVIFKTDDAGNNLSRQFDFFEDDNATNPETGVVLGLDGHSLWGFTRKGGTNDEGTYYQYDIPLNYFARRVQFNASTSGAYPKANITDVDSDEWYGTTSEGGTHGHGTIFEISSGSQTILHNFNAPDNSDYGFPIGTMKYYNGYLYGIYRMNTSGYPHYGLFKFNTATKVLTHLAGFGSSYTKYINFPILLFSGDHNSLYISIDDKIYDYNLSTGNLSEVIYLSHVFDEVDAFIKVSETYYFISNWVLYILDVDNGTKEYVCNGADNVTVASNGMLYVFNDSYIQEYNPSTKLVNDVFRFEGSTGYDRTFRGDIVERNNVLYGTIQNNGKYDNGAIFSFDIGSYEFNIVHSFKGAIGHSPKGKLLKHYDGKLYGLLSKGSSSNFGSFFSYNPVNKDIDILHMFNVDSEDGRNPNGSLISAEFGDYEYVMGTTFDGGEHSKGSVFSYRTSPNRGYSKKVNFNGAINGESPNGDLLQAANGNIYGLTFQGGEHGYGVLFKLSTEDDGDSFSLTVLHDFDDSSDDGGSPAAGLCESSGFLWGLTYRGGTDGKGVLFIYNPNTETYNKQVDFTGVNGTNPIGNLIEYNGKLYGVTVRGGANEKGTLFEYNKQNGALIVKYSFDDNGKGYYPMGGLTVSNSKLYGMCSNGGTGDKGTMYEFNPADGTLINKKSFNTSNGADPLYNSLLTTCISTSITPDMENLPVIHAQCEIQELDEPFATSNCGYGIEGSTDTDFPIVEQGINIVAWTYEDKLGNIITQNQTVIIDDITDPVPLTTILPEIRRDCSVLNPLKNSPKAIDNCKGTFYGTADVTFPITTKGTTIITWAYDDGNGNVTTQTQNAVVGIDNSVTVNGSSVLTANATGGSYTYQWYKCTLRQPIIIEGATSQSYTAKVAGIYKVIISNGTCSSTSDCYNSSVSTGIENVKAKYGISIYPNPTNDIINIENKNNSELVISIYDASGNKIESVVTKDYNTKIQLGKYVNGMYFMVINAGKETFSQKIIKR